MRSIYLALMRKAKGPSREVDEITTKIESADDNQGEDWTGEIQEEAEQVLWKSVHGCNK